MDIGVATPSTAPSVACPLGPRKNLVPKNLDDKIVKAPSPNGGLTVHSDRTAELATMSAMRVTLLLLEDDSAIADTLAFAFEREGWLVHHVLLVQQAHEAALRLRPTAAVLDVGLPDGNGLDLCRRWRSSTDTHLAALPTLMLTARGEEMDRVLGLEAGADDYLPKPFSPRELVARVRALLRRAAMPKPQTVVHGFELDEAGQNIRYFGATLPLTRMEYGLLKELLQAGGRILTRETLLARVWGEQTDAADRTVDTHIKTLRAKLRQAHEGPDPISTHRGLGYRLARAN
jgi:two-component system, OmpR family, catabolic regulation response regulator CreB